MPAARHIVLTALLLTADPISGVGQELRPGEGPATRSLPQIGIPHGAISFGVEPLDENIGWLRLEVDPIERARRKIHLAMRERARERALESQTEQGRSTPTDPGIDVGDWRFSIGNNGNWSPYPDRELDARNIRFPLRMKTDNRTPAEKALERMRQEKRQ